MLPDAPPPARRRFDDPAGSRAWRQRTPSPLGPLGVFQLLAGALGVMAAAYLARHFLFPLGSLLAMPLGFLLGAFILYTLPWLAIGALLSACLQP